MDDYTLTWLIEVLVIGVIIIGAILWGGPKDGKKGSSKE